MFAERAMLFYRFTLVFELFPQINHNFRQVAQLVTCLACSYPCRVYWESFIRPTWPSVSQHVLLWSWFWFLCVPRNRPGFCWSKKDEKRRRDVLWSSTWTVLMKKLIKSSTIWWVRWIVIEKRSPCWRCWRMLRKKYIFLPYISCNVDVSQIYHFRT